MSIQIYGRSYLARMTQTKQKQLFSVINSIESQLDHVRSLLIDEVPSGDWINTKEFSERSSLNYKTVCNYAGKGTIKETKKVGKRYFIHVSELKRWPKKK